MTPFEFVIVALAAARFTRLVVHDSIVDGPRARLYAWLDRQGPMGEKAIEGLQCVWCTGVWAAAGTWLIWTHLPAGRPVCWIAAVAFVAGITAAYTAPPDPEDEDDDT